MQRPKASNYEKEADYKAASRAYVRWKNSREATKQCVRPEAGSSELGVKVKTGKHHEP